ncbi:type II toxin-antitoxin system mRNA interferase toxin, RelE/StbE family [Candidatus Kaiserbacteria bacterium]|nr:type II toxin-antitoxin system mRNA interferase toxin, RelE/StbE family [Candidatus Kaiserbacteria bacterium]MBI5004111.1 type II toxin-antitoxin system mRNA interferase toxin, RelE/StbE family [Candidatus Kaiserbacteria bacterium]
MRFLTHRVFERQSKKLSHTLRDKMWERIAVLSVEEFNPLLNNHKLGHPYQEYRSINITGDYRLVYRRIDASTLYLRAVGTHHQLYGS